MSHVLVLATAYADGMTLGKDLHRGDLKSCERTRDLLPAVATSDPDVVGAQLLIMTEAEWQRATEPSSGPANDGSRTAEKK